MIAVFINVGAVLLGTLLGLLFGRKVNGKFQSTVLVSAGMTTLVIGFEMALKSHNILYLLLSLLIGGLFGQLWNIEGGILKLGEGLKKLLPAGKTTGRFAEGFLTASVLFCVGAMAILGSFQAGTEGKYDIILIKSVMDGFMAIVLTGAMGVGVGFSALAILIYQGSLTLMAGWAKPWVDANPSLLGEVSGVGGVLVMMIGVNLLELKKIPTANFLPSLALIVVFVAADPWLQTLHLF